MLIIKRILNPIRLLAKHIFFLLLGTGFALFIIAFLVVCWPIFVYRWVVTKVLAPAYFRRRGDPMAKAVNAAGNIAAAEFSQSEFVPRCTTIINLTLDGTITYNEVYQIIDEKWIKFKLGDEEALRYPELQQYPDPWMGFMFWKTDPNFQLENHIVVHTLDESKSDVEVDKFKCQLIEELINKVYVRKRSPWEMHLVQFFRETIDADGCPGKSVPSFNIILRIHHAMADGYALMHMLLEQFSGNDLEKTLLAVPKSEKEGKRNIFRGFWQCVTWPVAVIHELGHVLSWGFKGWGPLHIPDERKSWLQMYARMKPIPISKVKYIKSTFGVGFVSVLNSALAAALGKMLEKLDERGKRNNVKNLLFGVAVPRPNHPKKLRIHVLGAAFDVPVTLKIDPIDRLRKCEEHLLQLKTTPQVLLALVGLKVFSNAPTSIARFMVMNRIIATGVTNFPGPKFHVEHQGRQVLGMDFAAGAMPGVGGIGFMALSYVDKMQICATAENAVLERQELHELLGYVQEELDVLYSLAESHNSKAETANLLGEKNV